MRKIINRNLIKTNKKRLLITSIVVTMLMFFIMGNHSMLGMANKELNESVGTLIFNKCFSLSYFRMFILFVMCSGIFIVFSKNKIDELKDIVNKKKSRHEYLIKKTVLINIPIFVSIIINTFIKLILYYINSNFFEDNLVIKLSIVFIFSIYTITLSFIFYSIVVLFNIAIKDYFMAAIIPLFTFDGFILIFGISTLFISDKLMVIKKAIEPISRAIVRVLDLLYFNIRFENQEVRTQAIILSVLLGISILILYISYIMLGLIKLKDLNRIYIFEVFRYVFYIVISILIGFYGVSGVGFLLLFLGTKYSFDQGALYINMISLVAIVLIYALLEVVYKYKLKRVYNRFDEEDVSSSLNENNIKDKIEENDIVEEEKISLINKMKDFIKNVDNYEEDEKEIEIEKNKEEELDIKYKPIKIDETAIINTEEIRERINEIDTTLVLNDKDSEIIRTFTNEITHDKKKNNDYQDYSNDIQKYFTTSILNEKNNEENYYQISFVDIESFEEDKENFEKESIIKFTVDESDQFNFLSILEDKSK